MERLISVFGMILIVGFAVLISKDRKNISWRLVGWGIALQIIFALIIFNTGAGAKIFIGADWFFNKIFEFTGKATEDFFGMNLVPDPNDPAALRPPVILSIVTVIIFVSSVAAILYYLRIIQAIVYGMAKLMQLTMRASGAESLSSSLFVIMGIETVTAIKTYIKNMTSSELLTLMTGFMATIAGSVMAVYVNVFGAKAGHLLTASIMSAPAAILLSKIMLPETEKPLTAGTMEWGEMKPEESNVVEAAANGAVDGVKLAINVAAILIAFTAIIAMFDAILASAGTSFGHISGYLFSPIAFIMGVPWHDCVEVGRLLGIKVVANEMLSFKEMQSMAAGGNLDPRSITISTYALCSFANFGSLGIMISAIAALAPERAREVAKLGLKALLAGFLAGCMTATIAGFLIHS